MESQALTQQQILNIIKIHQSALSVKGIIEFSHIEDAPSEVWASIKEECWDMVENGILEAWDRREEEDLPESVRKAFFYIK